MLEGERASGKEIGSYMKSSGCRVQELRLKMRKV